MAFLGWQFDVRPLQGLTFPAPVAPVEGLVRASHIELARPGGVDIPLTLLRAESGGTSATLTFRARMDGRRGRFRATPGSSPPMAVRCV